MPDIPFTPEQEARLREMCGLRDGEQLTSDMFMKIMETRDILEAEFRRLSEGGPS